MTKAKLPPATGRGITRLRVFSRCIATTGLACPGNCRKNAAGTRATVTFTTDRTHENARGTAHPRSHLNGMCRAVDGTCATFNTGIPVDNSRLSVFHIEYPMRTDDGTHPAAIAGFGIKLQSHNIL